MRISKIRCNNFKSLLDFEVTLSHFTCLVGMNGSGKSTLLQFVDFLSQLMNGDIKRWLRERKWKRKDLLAWGNSAGSISFVVEMSDDGGEPSGSWTGSFDTHKLRCDSEAFVFGETRFEVKNNQFTASNTGRSYDLALEYEGSLLARIRDTFLPEPIAQFRDFFRGSLSLELLSPRLMRGRTKSAAHTIGRGGESLSAYLHDLSSEKRESIESHLRAAYPHFHALVTSSQRSGAKILEVEESFSGRIFRTEARQLNDGLLRILAFVANLESESPLLTFDEIENGINPELIGFLVDRLTGSRPQVIVTTHSPVILNYLTDAVAKESMVYLYKTPQGVTKAVPFFDIPSMTAKLKFMGPGEVFADTDLTKLADEITAMGRGGVDVSTIQR